MLALLLAYGSVAQAGTYFLDADKKIKIDTPYNLSTVDDISDVAIAINVGRVDYLKNALAKDPNLIKNINNALYGSRLAPVGFNAKDYATIELVKKYDPNLFDRKTADERNIILNLFFEHFEFYHSDEVKKENDMIISELEKNKFPLTQDVKKFLNEGRGKQAFEDLIIKLIDNLNATQLNQVDKWGNTVLHYAVYSRNYKVVNHLLQNPNFRMQHATNYLKENALFMLLSNNCNVKTDPKIEKDILELLLNAKLNTASKNSKGNSFAGMVFAFPEFNHLKDLASKDLTNIRKKIAEKESEKLVSLVGASNAQDVKFGAVSTFSQAKEYTLYMCDMKKMKY